MLNVILLSGFIIFALGLAAFFAFSSIQLQSISSEVDEIKSLIVSQEKTEQAVVLLKDRLAKIGMARGVVSSIKIFSRIEPFLINIGPNSNLSELSIDPQKLDLSVVFRSNSDLSAFLKNISDSEVFKFVTLTTFGYNPASGYLATFHIL
ncbi:MAG: hypothetical protein UT58_C0009G0011 [Microgenomates group bacterium GW2011_GWC1_39_7b]|nr:MAG: hypothetical protein UT58_C0009G0011 [Microgenomates group bacterium GW2011_GWC1_39_7b]